MSEVKVNKISPRSGTDVALGDSGDTFTIPSGATLTNNGTASGIGQSGGAGNTPSTSPVQDLEILADFYVGKFKDAKPKEEDKEAQEQK